MPEDDKKPDKSVEATENQWPTLLEHVSAIVEAIFRLANFKPGFDQRKTQILYRPKPK